jgi:hypothetical protein
MVAKKLCDLDHEHISETITAKALPPKDTFRALLTACLSDEVIVVAKPPAKYLGTESPGDGRRTPDG